MSLADLAHRDMTDPWGRQQQHWRVAEELQAPDAERLFTGSCVLGLLVARASSMAPPVAPAMPQAAQHQCGPGFPGQLSDVRVTMLLFFCSPSLPFAPYSLTLPFSTIHFKLIFCIIFLFGLVRVMLIFLAGPG